MKVNALLFAGWLALAVAEGFFIQRVCADAVWSQTFSVGP